MIFPIFDIRRKGVEVLDEVFANNLSSKDEEVVCGRCCGMGVVENQRFDCWVVEEKLPFAISNSLRFRRPL